MERIDVRGDRAVGVVLADGEEIRAGRTVSNADPKRTFLGLLDPSLLPARFTERLGVYRCEGASLKINLAVAELPKIPGVDDGSGVRSYHRGLVQVTKPLGELDRDQASARAGGAGDRCARRALHPVGPRSFVGAGRPPRRDARRARAAVPVARRFVGRGA